MHVRIIIIIVVSIIIAIKYKIVSKNSRNKNVILLLAITVEEADYISDVSGDNCPSSDESGKKVVDKQMKQSPSVVDRTYFFDSVLDKNVRN